MHAPAGDTPTTRRPIELALNEPHSNVKEIPSSLPHVWSNSEPIVSYNIVANSTGRPRRDPRFSSLQLSCPIHPTSQDPESCLIRTQNNKHLTHYDERLTDIVTPTPPSQSLGPGRPHSVNAAK
jgi:hypothetical protein